MSATAEATRCGPQILCPSWQLDHVGRVNAPYGIMQPNKEKALQGRAFRKEQWPIYRILWSICYELKVRLKFIAIEGIRETNYECPLDSINVGTDCSIVSVIDRSHNKEMFM